jgi:hypothetical protein
LRNLIPNEFDNVTVHVKAIGVLEAFINLVSQQLTYLNTFGKKAGLSPFLSLEAYVARAYLEKSGHG